MPENYIENLSLSVGYQFPQPASQANNEVQAEILQVVGLDSNGDYYSYHVGGSIEVVRRDLTYDGLTKAQVDDLVEILVDILYGSRYPFTWYDEEGADVLARFVDGTVTWEKTGVSTYSVSFSLHSME